MKTVHEGGSEKKYLLYEIKSEINSLKTKIENLEKQLHNYNLQKVELELKVPEQITRESEILS